MIYIIDHQDSFTWNVVHQFSKFDKVVCNNYFELRKPKKICFNKALVIFFDPSKKSIPYPLKPQNW